VNKTTNLVDLISNESCCLHDYVVLSVAESCQLMLTKMLKKCNFTCT